jgi:D-alanine-D-alanine ligase
MKVLVLFDLARPPRPDENFSARHLKEDEDKPTEADVLCALRRLGHEVDTLAVYDNVNAVIEKLHTFAPDVVFNLCMSFFDDRSHEPNIPALLDLMKVRYTGAAPETIMLCKDKALAKKVLAYHRVRVARFVVSRRSRPLRKLSRFVFPAFVKPVGEEASDGISKASFARDEGEALERARFIQDKFASDALIEEYIVGRELYVGVLGQRRLTVLPARELFFDQVADEVPKFATFKAKWDDAYRKRWGIRNGPAAPLPDGVSEQIAKVTRTECRELKIRGLGRLDMRLTDAGEIVVLEANPNPSLAMEDDFAKAAGMAGIDYDALMQKILDTALADV